MASAPDSPLGDYIRRQREVQKLSLRQLADLVGIINPHEHGPGAARRTTKRGNQPWWPRFAPIPS
jgi:transcriptional regulator with XRE-family HTH domain